MHTDVVKAEPRSGDGVRGSLVEAQRVTAGLEQADWTGRRELIRTLVKRVEIGAEAVNVVFRVEPGPLNTSPQSESLLHCGRRERSPLRDADSTAHFDDLFYEM